MAKVYTSTDAVLSPCARYRYSLRRTWGLKPGRIAFVGLNPSTADGTLDDPTIRRCVGFADMWGYHDLVMLNLFAYRATDPERMGLEDDPVGPDNDQHLALELAQAKLVVCAWGATGGHTLRAAEVMRLVLPRHKARCLGLTRTGFPRHPLYVQGATILERY